MLIAVQHSIRSRLQDWIDERGLDYSTLARESGVGIGVIRRLAKNQFDRVDCANWEAICQFFDKPIDQLFYASKGE
jgi:hypothetical protein